MTRAALGIALLLAACGAPGPSPAPPGEVLRPAPAIPWEQTVEGEVRTFPRLLRLAHADELWARLVASGLELPADSRELGLALRELPGEPRLESYGCRDLGLGPQVYGHGDRPDPALAEETLYELARRCVPGATLGVRPSYLIVRGDDHQQARVRDLLDRLRALLPTLR